MYNGNGYSAGILIQAPNGSQTVIGNRCLFNNGSGITLSSSDNKIRNNLCSENQGYGFNIGTINNYITTNTADSNTSYAFYINIGGAVSTNTFQKNNIPNCCPVS